MQKLLQRTRKLVIPALLALVAVVVVVDVADARRAGSFGSFGSRGARTFNAPPPTTTAPRPAAPIERTMTPRPAQQPGAAATAGQAAARPGLFGGGFLGPMLGGLALGGLIGMLMGNGIGGAAGFLGLLLQVGLIAVGVMLLMRFLRNRQSQQQPAYAGAGDRSRFEGAGGQGMGGQGMGGLSDAPRGSSSRGSVPASGPAVAADDRTAGPSEIWPGDEIGVGQEDLDAFEKLLREIQEAYGAEDFAALRARTTPEVMGYLAEELGANATRGVRNEVSNVKLLGGDVAEAWREGATEYATVGLRYESVDVTRERATGAVVDGAEEPTESTEVWTFVREPGEDWKLTAIQEA